ncbi:hypothetical protein D9M69_562160 [compost metagenome]
MDNVVNFPAGAVKAWRAVEPVYRDIALGHGAPAEKLEIILDEMKGIHAALHDESPVTLTLSPEIGLTEKQGQLISQGINACLGEYTSRMSKRWYSAHDYILKLIVEKYR